MKSFLLLLWAIPALFAIQAMPLPNNIASIPVTQAFQALLTKEPSHLDPEVAVIVGTIYCQGSKEMKVLKNQKRCFEYLDFASEKKVVLADLVKANQYALNEDHKNYQAAMEKVMKSGDIRLSVPAGLQLAGYFASKDMTGKSVETLRYVADVYGDSRAQFMVAYSILNGDHIPNDLTKKDGRFYLYQACTNINIDPMVKQKCEIYNKGN